MLHPVAVQTGFVLAVIVGYEVGGRVVFAVADKRQGRLSGYIRSCEGVKVPERQVGRISAEFAIAFRKDGCGDVNRCCSGKGSALRYRKQKQQQ